ncbi:MAG TPA: hypothetical protein VGG29_05170 [Caulobacteraceae bacterium]|jgi:hypothetical protein
MLTSALAAAAAAGPAAAQKGVGTMVVQVGGKTLTFTGGECGFGPTAHTIAKYRPFDPGHPENNLPIFDAAVPTPAAKYHWATVGFTENGVRRTLEATGDITPNGGKFQGKVHSRGPGEPASGSFTCTFPPPPH